MQNEPPIGYLVNRTARMLRRLADHKLASLGLSSAHLPVWTALAQTDALSQKALTDLAGIEQPTMAATLGRMERDGIIERRTDPTDRRSARFALSEQTRERTAAIRSAVEDLNDIALANLSSADRAKLRQLLHELIATVEAAIGA